MSIATRADIRHVLNATRNGQPDLGGGLTAEAILDDIFVDGNIAVVGGINRVFQKLDFVAPFVGAVVIDMDADAAPPDASLSLAVLRYLYIEADPTNTQDIELDPTVLNGWDTVYAGKVTIQPGEVQIFRSRVGAPVGVDKLMSFSALVSDQKIRRLVILGATA